MIRSKYTDDEIVVLLWLFRIANYTPEIPKELLLLLNRVTSHSIDSLVLYLSNIESSYTNRQKGGLRSLSKTGKKHFDNYIGENATGNILKDGPIAFKAITGEEPPQVISDLNYDIETTEERSKMAEPSEVFLELLKDKDFDKFCKMSNQKFQTCFDNGRIKTFNSSGKARSAWIKDLYKALEYIKNNYDIFESTIVNHFEFNSKSHLNYAESPYRAAYDKILPINEFDEIYSWAVEQTPSFTETLNKIIGFTLKRSDCSIRKTLILTYENIETFLNLSPTNNIENIIDITKFRQVVFQPCSSLIARNNFSETIENEILLIDMEDDLDINDYEELNEISDSFGLWGVINVAPKTWKRLEDGALVLFFANRKAFAAATIIKKFVNASLSSKLWGEVNDGSTYKHMYAVKDLQYVDIPQKLINSNLRYQENFIVQRFQVLDKGPSSTILSAIGQMNVKKDNLSKRGSGWRKCDSCDVTFLESELENNICRTC